MFLLKLLFKMKRSSHMIWLSSLPLIFIGFQLELVFVQKEKKKKFYLFEEFVYRFYMFPKPWRRSISVWLFHERYSQSFGWLSLQSLSPEKMLSIQMSKLFLKISENRSRFLFTTFYLPRHWIWRKEEKKKNKAITNDSMYKHKSYTPCNNLLFVARTPQTWTTCILLFNFAWILYTTLHEDTPPHHKTPRFRIFDDIWIVSCHSHSWLVLSSFYIVYERYARIRI